MTLSFGGHLGFEPILFFSNYLSSLFFFEGGGRGRVGRWGLGVSLFV